MYKITKIEEEERKVGLNLLEKKNALCNLQMILEEKELIKNCQKEHEMVVQEYEQWWKEIIDKYCHEYPEGEKFIVDFANGEMFLDNKE